MNTKIIFFLILISFIFSILLFNEYSYAQSSQKNQLTSNSDTFIFVQTIVENSEGQIVTYLTSHKFTFLDSKLLDSLLESEASENDPIIDIENKKYQLIQRKITVDYNKENVIASTILGTAKFENIIPVARFAHDGYPILDGEKVRSIWTFLRPID